VAAYLIAEDALDEQLVHQRSARIVSEDAVQPCDVAVEGRCRDHEQYVDGGRRQPELVNQLGDRRRLAAMLWIRGQRSLVLGERVSSSREVVRCEPGVRPDEGRDLVLVRMMTLVAVAEPPRVPRNGDRAQRPQRD